MRVSPSVTLAAAVVLTACQPPAPPAPPVPPAPSVPAVEPAPAAVAMRGQFVIGKDGYGITLCGEQTQRIVKLGEQANAMVSAMAEVSAREFFIEGFGTARSDTGGSIDRIEIAGIETQGCEAPITPFLFKARGTEPFWALSIAEGQLRLERPGAPVATGPINGSPMQGDQRRFFTTTNTGPLEIKFSRAICQDGMSESRYAWTAVATFDGKDWQGCGNAGE